MRGFRAIARKSGCAALLLAGALWLAAPAVAAVPGPPELPAAGATAAEPEPCTFARCAPRNGSTWGTVAGFGGAIAFCGWVGRRRR
jgi:hypothetical protein